MFSYGIFLADALSSETANLILDYGKIDFSTLNSYKIGAILHKLEVLDKKLVTR